MGVVRGDLESSTVPCTYFVRDVEPQAQTILAATHFVPFEWMKEPGLDSFGYGHASVVH
jgi:hypothetical protein